MDAAAQKRYGFNRHNRHNRHKAAESAEKPGMAPDGCGRSRTVADDSPRDVTPDETTSRTVADGSDGCAQSYSNPAPDDDYDEV